MDLHQQVRWKDGLLFHARAAQTCRNVLACFSGIKGMQLAAQSDALFELPKLRRFELGIEFRLPCNDDLHQLSTTVLEIAEHTDFLEDFPFEVVGFVNQENGKPAGFGPLDQHIVQRQKHFGFRVPIAVQREIVSHHLEELIWSQAGIEQKCEGDLLRAEKIAQAFEHGGLTGADLSREDDEAFTAVYAVNQISQSLLVLNTFV